MHSDPTSLCDTLRENALQPRCDSCKRPALHRETLAFWRDIQAFRYQFEKLAYLDLIRVSSGHTPDFAKWRIGDGFDKSFAAHRAFGEPTAGSATFFYIHTLFVGPETRNVGIGSLLLNDVLHELRLLNPDPSVWLCAQPKDYGDDRLYRFYGKRGFRRCHPNSRLMYFDNKYTRHVRLDPQGPVDGVKYLPESGDKVPVAEKPTPADTPKDTVLPASPEAAPAKVEVADGNNPSWSPLPTATLAERGEAMGMRAFQ